MNLQDQAEDRLFDGLERHPLTWVLIASMTTIHLGLGAIMWARGHASVLDIFIKSRGPRLLRRCGAMSAGALDRGELWRLVSAVFLHGGPLHLVLNMVALYALGRLMEAVYGSVRFAWLFVLSGAMGAAVSWLGHNDLSVGSSGGIFGLLGAAIVFGWRHRGALPPQADAFFRVKLLPWLALNLLIGFVVPVIDQLGHLGGLLGGSVLAMVLGNRVVPGEDSGRLAHLGMGLGTLVLVAWAVWGVWGKWS